jgi:hypothetical protein
MSSTTVNAAFYLCYFIKLVQHCSDNNSTTSVSQRQGIPTAVGAAASFSSHQQAQPHIKQKAAKIAVALYGQVST